MYVLRMNLSVKRTLSETKTSLWVFLREVKSQPGGCGSLVVLLCIGNVSLRYQKADLGWILHAFDDPVEILSSGGGNAPWHQMYTCTCQIIIMHGRNDFWSNFPERLKLWAAREDMVW